MVVVIPELMLWPLLEHTIVVLASQLVLKVRYIVVEGFASSKDLDDFSKLNYILLNTDCSLVGNCIEGICLYKHFFEGR